MKEGEERKERRERNTAVGIFPSSAVYFFAFSERDSSALRIFVEMRLFLFAKNPPEVVPPAS